MPSKRIIISLTFNVYGEGGGPTTPSLMQALISAALSRVEVKGDSKVAGLSLHGPKVLFVSTSAKIEDL